MTIKKNQVLQLIQPPVFGIVLEVRYNELAEELEGRLEYVDAAGETQTRWFLDSQLEESTNG